jgi:hypothetical protein
MHDTKRVNFEVFARASRHLVVILSPMHLAIERLPHYKSSEFDATSTLLINPGNGNFYRDCIAEVRAIIADAMHSTGATRLVFCGSSMGAYGALYFGTLFPETEYIVGYAPSIRLDHPGTLSEQAMPASLLLDEDAQHGELLERIRRSEARVFLFHPCIDVQDGRHILDCDALADCANVTRYHLLCEHDLHRYIGLPRVVAGLLKENAPPLEDIRPLLASEEEITYAKRIYDFYLHELQGKELDFAYSALPVENSANWRYFYWKARNLSHHGQAWQSLSNFMIAMAHGGNKVAEAHFCIANVYKDLGLRHAALGHYQEAYKLDPNSAITTSTICQLLTK